ncbi:MAG: poly-gamma-glutamate biosynthesis protein PgsC [Bacteroidetes bacterium]|jgi:gamma-polyglutamate biosynthesis protein CapC|nr:poly-gamma-glutamate biosynthesis protein PgsC [Bacteroidota bacterium]MBT5426611.1 poly-gamma-glutamate biosynthesis protein PgsC [Bacteroidota bacterium]
MSYELFFIGLAITLVFISLTGYYPGGIIVPAYLVLFVDQPLRLIGTLVIAFMAWGLYRLASRYLILFGKRRFVFLILSGAIGAFVLSYILPQFFPGSVELKVIGWVIPGLMASQLEKQGPLITLSALAIVLTILFFIGKLFYLIF